MRTYHKTRQKGSEKPTPQVLAFCRCSECCCTPYVGTTGDVLFGRHVTLAQFKAHHDRDAKVQTAAKLLQEAEPQVAPSTRKKADHNQLQPKDALTHVDIPRAGAAPVKPIKSSSSRAKRHQPVAPCNAFLTHLSSLRISLQNRPVAALFGGQPLVFTHPPTRFLAPDSQASSLNPSASQNDAFMRHERWLREAQRRVHCQLKQKSQAVSAHERLLASIVEKTILKAMEELEKCKNLEWTRQYDLSITLQAPVIDMCESLSLILPILVYSDHTYTANYLKTRKFLQEPFTCLAYLFASFLYLLSGISQLDVNVSLAFIILIYKNSLKESTNAETKSIISSIPSDIRPVIHALELEPKTRASICCPKCFCTYPMELDKPATCSPTAPPLDDPNLPSDNSKSTPNSSDMDGQSDISDFNLSTDDNGINAPHIPTFCSYQRTRMSNPCSFRLRSNDPTRDFLTREFIHQDLHQWIGRMYARPDIEAHLDDYPTKAMKTKGLAQDIWDGSALRELRGPDGKQLFMDGPHGEARLVFGLNEDGFIPHGASNSHKQHAVGGMYMVCYNLPPEIRYDIENVFLVGIIPGPVEPSKDQMNHVLRPLVDDLLILWLDGIYLTQMPRFPHGRLVQAALIPLICDLPAARRVSGLGSHSFKLFCSECKLLKRDINNLDSSQWPPRNREEHINHAETWKNAENEPKQKAHFDRHGVCWSELLRLPYWDPTQYIVIDTMHGFYLRLFLVHIKEIWGMKTGVPDGEGLGEPDLDNLDEVDASEAERVLHEGSMDQLRDLEFKQLYYLCQSANLPCRGTEEHEALVMLLHQLVSGNTYFK